MLRGDELEGHEVQAVLAPKDSGGVLDGRETTSSAPP